MEIQSWGFVLALFQSTCTTANIIGSEHTQDKYKVIPGVCKVEILQITLNKIEVLLFYHFC